MQAFSILGFKNNRAPCTLSVVQHTNLVIGSTEITLIYSASIQVGIDGSICETRSDTNGINLM